MLDTCAHAIIAVLLRMMVQGSTLSTCLAAHRKSDAVSLCTQAFARNTLRSGCSCRSCYAACIFYIQSPGGYASQSELYNFARVQASSRIWSPRKHLSVSMISASPRCWTASRRSRLSS